MFSFQLSDDLVTHQIPPTISFQQPARNHQDLAVEVHDHVFMDANTNKSTSKARKKHGDHSPNSSKPNSGTTDLGVGDDKDDQTTQKKLVHRQIERQRRQEMAKLYASLRDLLPLEFIKGKRSTSDHMHQAVSYIKHMQENIKDLSVKRDQLKKLMETASGSELNTNEKSIMNLVPNTVSISSCNGEIQISINSCLIEDGFPLSGVLNAILEEGLKVISCTCTKVNDRLLHSIQSEANDPVSTDLSMLQQRLTAIANNYY